jgi:hypothetical protein
MLSGYSDKILRAIANHMRNYDVKDHQGRKPRVKPVFCCRSFEKRGLRPQRYHDANDAAERGGGALGYRG